LMERCCPQSTANAHDQAQEPERIHPDSISRRREWGWFNDRRGDGSTSYIRVGKNLIDVPKIKSRGILTVRPQVLDGHGKECSNGSRE
jgi:hypothetical protein